MALSAFKNSEKTPRDHNNATTTAHESASGKSRRPSKKPKKRKPAVSLNLSSWNTSDEDEIERRRLRAKIEKMSYQALEPEYDYFGSFRVTSKDSQGEYRVEIRSLVEHLNSCDCLDYLGNQLGTCKHIEYVLLRLQKNRKKHFKQAGLEGSPRIEIYLDRREEVNTLRIGWSKKVKKSVLVEPLTSFFNAEGNLQSDLVDTHSQIQTLLLNNKSLRKRVRYSTHIQEAIDTILLKREQEAKNTLFLEEWEQGKYPFGLKLPLYPYQQEGMLHLLLKQRALLADEMGLGKTVQAIAACELLNRIYGVKKVLVVATASLKTEWEEQLSKFTSLKSLIIQGHREKRLKQYGEEAHFYLTNYEQIIVDGPEIQALISPDVIILDEAQRIKNWQTKTAQAIKQLKSPYAFVLTGTPLENRIDDIYSVIQFLDPHLFGPLFRFNRHFYQVDELGKPLGYKNLDELQRRLKPIMLRRLKKDVEEQLPTRTVNHYFVKMEKEQRLRYEFYETKVARLVSQARKRPLRKEEYERLQRWLACMRMICDSPYILDPNCRISPKLKELETILGELLQDKTVKVIIFSEWERMLKLVLELAQKRRWEVSLHTGSVPQLKRREAIKRFKSAPHCRLFLSTDAGSLGLNLQAANVVINLDLPWNPAKLEQRIARAWRKHQTRTVRVINLVCEQSIEHRMLGLLSQKASLASGILEGDETLKEMALPSGRQALIERLETLIDAPLGVQPAPIENEIHYPASPPEENVNLDKSLERFSETVQDWVRQAVEAAKEALVKTLVVVSKEDERNQVQALLGQTPSTTLELIDRKSLALIQHLEKTGYLTLNAIIKILPENTAAEHFISTEWLEKARSFLTYALRKQSVAHTFLQQDFLEESITAIRGSLESAIEAFSCLSMAFNKEKITQNFIQVLIEQHGLPKHVLALWLQLSHLAEESKVLSTTLLQAIFEEHRIFLEHIQEKINKRVEHKLNVNSSRGQLQDE